MGNLTHKVKETAYSLGFCLAGVTTPHPPPHFSTYADWLAHGYHGEMAYLAEERARRRRANPQQILPACRSVLVLGYPYPRRASAGDLPALRGAVAAYACQEDYHTLLADKMAALVRFIQQERRAGVTALSYTDSGAILERDLAQRAGLGWQAKNTCLIHPQWGSYFFLAEIFLDVELEPDAPFAFDHCGSCTRCMQACPTGCILPGRVLDARRCISYLTIELKGAMPRALRSGVGTWVFGCDVCQQVCPWNQRLAQPSVSASEMNLEELLGLTEQDFNARFKNSPIRRAKRRGLLRNAAVVLGNTKDIAAVPVLAQALAQDEEALVRSHAAWALGQIDTPASQRALNQANTTEKDAGVLEEIRHAIARRDNREDSHAA